MLIRFFKRAEKQMIRIRENYSQAVTPFLLFFLFFFLSIHCFFLINCCFSEEEMRMKENDVRESRLELAEIQRKLDVQHKRTPSPGLIHLFYLSSLLLIYSPQQDQRIILFF